MCPPLIKQALHLICMELRKAMKATLSQSLVPKQNALKAIDLIRRVTYGYFSQPARKGRLSVYLLIKSSKFLPMESYTAAYS